MIRRGLPTTSYSTLYEYSHGFIIVGRSDIRW